MPKCRYCNKNITKFDKEICPYCGGSRPLEGVESNTVDITQTIDVLNDKESTSFVQHKRITNGLLMMFLGMFSGDLFYLGFIKNGIIRLIVNLVFFVILFSIFYFLEIFSSYSLLLSLIIPFGILFIFYFILGLIVINFKNKKDSNGVFLK